MATGRIPTMICCQLGVLLQTEVAVVAKEFAHRDGSQSVTKLGVGGKE